MSVIDCATTFDFNCKALRRSGYASKIGTEGISERLEECLRIMTDAESPRAKDDAPSSPLISTAEGLGVGPGMYSAKCLLKGIVPIVMGSSADRFVVSVDLNSIENWNDQLNESISQDKSSYYEDKSSYYEDKLP